MTAEDGIIDISRVIDESDKCFKRETKKVSVLFGDGRKQRINRKSPSLRHNHGNASFFISEFAVNPSTVMSSVFAAYEAGFSGNGVILTVLQSRNDVCFQTDAFIQTYCFRKTLVHKLS